MVQSNRSHVQEHASVSPKKPSSSSGRPSKHTQQARWEQFGGERAKKKREPRKIVWSSCGFLNDLRPEDPTLFETVLRQLGEQEVAHQELFSVELEPPDHGSGQAVSSLGSPTPGTILQRPQSAPNVGSNRSSPRVTNKRPGSSSRPQRHHLTRPQSAPRLLDGSGLLEKRPHRSSFLQRVEDLAVRDTIEKFKTDARGEKAASASIDFMHDSSLFDLRVLHNPTARARSAKIRCESPPRNAPLSPSKGGARGTAGVHRIGPRHPKWRELPAVDQMRNLWHVMDMDLRLHSPAPREAEIAPSPPAPEALERSSSPPNLLMASFSDALNFGELHRKKGLRTSHFLANQSPDMLRITVNLLDFVLEKCITLAEFVRVLTVSKQDNITKAHGDGHSSRRDSSRRDDKSCKVTRREWETALMAMDYVSDDPSRLFRALDQENAGELMCEEIVDVLEAHYPNLVQRRLKPPSPVPKRNHGKRQSWPLDKDESQAHVNVIGIPGASPIPSESEASESYQAL